MTPRERARLRRAVDAAGDKAATAFGPDVVAALLDQLDACERSVRRVAAERDHAVRRAQVAEATVALLREELDDVTDGWFDTVEEVDFGNPDGRPLLRAIPGGAGA